MPELAKSARAALTAEAVSALIAAARRRSRTVQWMPDGDGCRFEVIVVDSGAIEAVAHVAADGSTVLRDA